MNTYLGTGLNYLITFTIFSIMNASTGGSSYIKWIFISSLIFFFIEAEYKLNPTWDGLV